MSLSVVESLLLGVFGIGIVFVVLIGLSLLLRLQSMLVDRFMKKKPAAVPAIEVPCAVFPDEPPAMDAEGGAESGDGDAKQYFVDVNSSRYKVNIGVSQLQTSCDDRKMPRTVQASPPPEAAPAKESKHAPAPMPKSAPAPAPGGGETVISPVPGVVTDIKTTVGAKVRRGQVLLLLEAMKMENDITAPGEGTVTQILVSKGASVVTGTPLIEIQ